MKDLLPCPFCGSKAELKQTSKLKIRIRCTKCLIGIEQKVLRLSIEWLEDKMIEMWNTRA